MLRINNKPSISDTVYFVACISNIILLEIYVLHVVFIYESIATVGEIRVWWRADFQSGSRVLKKVF